MRSARQLSLLMDKKLRARHPSQEPELQCKICLYDCPQSVMVRLEECGCLFCRDVSSHGRIRENLQTIAFKHICVLFASQN